MRSRILSILGILSIILTSCAPESTSEQSATGKLPVDITRKIDKVFRDFDNTSPGCALSVIQDGEIIYSKGYGMADLEHNVPITPQTVFYIGSVSKQFVTFSILLLEEKGLLSLDDDVRKYIPEFPDYGYKLTIRHFIHHTSGVRDYLTLWELAGNTYLDHVPKDAIIDMICRQKELNFEPGSQYLYSNSCYFMLSLIVERITGQSMNEFAQENIFQPLGMGNTRFHDDNTNLIPNRAFSYYSNDNNDWKNMILRFDLVGSGGIYSTVEDLYEWDQNFYNNRLGLKRQALVDTMKTDGKLNDGSPAGYAFALANGNYRGLRTIGHGGALAGYRAYYVQFPEVNTSFVVLGNFAQFRSAGKVFEVADILLADHLGPEEEDDDPSGEDASSEKEKEPLQLTDSQFEGRYYSEELDTYCDLFLEEDRYWVQVKYNDKVECAPAGGFEFSAGNYMKMRFEMAEGNTSGFRLDAGRVRNLWFEKV